MTIKILWRAFTKAEYSFEYPKNDMAPLDLLEWVFRQFNHVNDRELISMLKLPYPSLSVNDFVLLDNHLYKCMPAGWEFVTEL